MPRQAAPDTVSEMPDPAAALIVGKRGISIPWKTCLIVGAVILGGGGASALTQFGLAGNASEVDLASFRADQDQRHSTIDGTLEIQSKATAELRGEIKTVGERLSSVQDVQQRSLARDEARRVTISITDRAKREREYDRLVDLNLGRLRRGLDPCGSVSCE